MKTATWNPIVRAVVALCTLSLPGVAYAHSAEAGSGFFSGLAHPIHGPDHFLAMFSVGIVSSQIGGKYIWILPGMFVTFMVIGGLMGIYGLPVPYVEYGIALSVVMLGMAILFIHQSQRSWLHLVIAMTCIFGIMHGYAHGVEMPNSASPIYYSFGFLTSTAGIHLLGVLVGHQLMRGRILSRMLRGLGAAISGTGMVMFAAHAGMF